MRTEVGLWSGQGHFTGQDRALVMVYMPEGDTSNQSSMPTNQIMYEDETPFMYSSTDLLNWTPLGAQASIDQMWRPKYAKPNGEFWV